MKRADDISSQLQMLIKLQSSLKPFFDKYFSETIHTVLCEHSSFCKSNQNFKGGVERSAIAVASHIKIFCSLSDSFSNRKFDRSDIYPLQINLKSPVCKLGQSNLTIGLFPACDPLPSRLNGEVNRRILNHWSVNIRNVAKWKVVEDDC